MAHPDPYKPLTDFAASPTGVVEPVATDIELQAIARVFNQMRDNIRKIQRDDGALADKVVTLDALDTSVAGALSAGWKPRGAWGAGVAYAPNDYVSVGSLSYVCVAGHVATADFNADRDAGRWMVGYQAAVMQTVPVRKVFSGNGVTLTFTVDNIIQSADVFLVFVNSVLNTAFTATVGTYNVTLAAAPGVGTNNVVILHWRVVGSAVVNDLFAARDTANASVATTLANANAAAASAAAALVSQNAAAASASAAATSAATAVTDVNNAASAALASIDAASDAIDATIAAADADITADLAAVNAAAAAGAVSAGAAAGSAAAAAGSAADAAADAIDALAGEQSINVALADLSTRFVPGGPYASAAAVLTAYPATALYAIFAHVSGLMYYMTSLSPAAAAPIDSGGSSLTQAQIDFLELLRTQNTPLQITGNDTGAVSSTAFVQQELGVEATARTAAIAAAIATEVSDRDAAIAAAIATEVSDRDAAIAAATSGFSAGAHMLATRAALEAISVADATARPWAQVLGAASAFDGWEGLFAFVTGNQAALVTADPSKALYVAPSAANTGASGVWARVRPNRREYPASWWLVSMTGLVAEQAKIRAAMATISALSNGGDLRLGDGTLLVGEVTGTPLNSGAKMGARCAIWFKENAVSIRGNGQGRTTVKLANAANCNLFQWGMGEIGGAANEHAVAAVYNCHLSDLKIDGNRTNQTAATLSAYQYSTMAMPHSGIETCEIERVDVTQALYSAYSNKSFDAANSSCARIRLKTVQSVNSGGDAFGFYGSANGGLGNAAEDLFIFNYGTNTALTGSSAVRVEYGWEINRGYATCGLIGAGSQTYGISVMLPSGVAETADVFHPVVVRGFVLNCYQNGAARTGIRNFAADTLFEGGMVNGWAIGAAFGSRGLRVVDAKFRDNVLNVSHQSNAGATPARNHSIIGCVIEDPTASAGVEIAADSIGINYTDCHIRNDAGTAGTVGVRALAGAKTVNFKGGSITGHATRVTDERGAIGFRGVDGVDDSAPEKTVSIQKYEDSFPFLSGFWSVAKGTATGALPAIVGDVNGGLLRTTLGNDAAVNMAANGAQVVGTNRVWSSAASQLVMEAAVRLTATAGDIAFFFGLTTSSTFRMPIVGAAGPVFTSPETSAVGLLIDPAAGSNNFFGVRHASAVTAGVDLGVVSTTNMRPVLKIVVNVGGKAVFFIDGVYAGEITGFAGAVCHPVFAFYNRNAGASPVIDIDAFSIRVRKD